VQEEEGWGAGRNNLKLLRPRTKRKRLQRN